MSVPNFSFAIIPAKTNVLAWSNEDTGVGPSIAEANQHSKNT
jgi:hypothetical protein